MARTHILKGFSDVDAALWIHSQTSGLTVSEMVSFARDNGMPVTDTANFEAVQVLSELGVADKSSRTLTTLGDAYYQIWQTRRSDAVDILHGLQYDLWKPTSPSENVSSWAYRTICEYLWEYQSLPDSSESLARYVNSQRSANAQIPPDVGNAFSNKSIVDAYDWLIPLDPPVILGVNETGASRSFRQTTFQRRAYCSTPLFLMGLDHLLRAQNQQYGDLVLLDGDSQRALCCFCLIDEAAVELMLDAALRRFPHLLSFQREWGAFITLTRPPVMHDFL